MASVSHPISSAISSHSVKGLCQIVGLACMAGFLLDMTILVLPPQFTDVEWRVGLMQQLANRSIILLIGSALLIFGHLEHRRWLKRLATFCLISGIAFFLSCFLVIADGLQFQQQTVNSINAQADQLQTKIQNAQSSLSEKLSSQDLQQASQLLITQAESLRQTARRTALKTSASSLGNLVIVGMGLISLGRYSMRLRNG